MRSKFLLYGYLLLGSFFICDAMEDLPSTLKEMCTKKEKDKDGYSAIGEECYQLRKAFYCATQLNNREKSKGVLSYCGHFFNSWDLVPHNSWDDPDEFVPEDWNVDWHTEQLCKASGITDEKEVAKHTEEATKRLQSLKKDETKK